MRPRGKSRIIIFWGYMMHNSIYNNTIFNARFHDDLHLTDHQPHPSVRACLHCRKHFLLHTSVHAVNRLVLATVLSTHFNGRNCLCKKLISRKRRALVYTCFRRSHNTLSFSKYTGKGREVPSGQEMTWMLDTEERRRGISYRHWLFCTTFSSNVNYYHIWKIGRRDTNLRLTPQPMQHSH